MKNRCRCLPAPTFNYRYGPFAEVLRSTGPMAQTNPFRFSTKFQDDETDLLYYGYRYYNASTGRWLSRDPINECGSKNICAAADNDIINRTDRLGLSWMDIWRDAGKNCCPSCAVAVVKKQLASQEKILSVLRTGKMPSTSPGVVIHATTRCLPGPSPGGTPQTDFQINTGTCTGWCVVRHEAIHRAQCESDYEDWYDKDEASKIAKEIPAYEAGVKCLKAIIRMAESQAARFGSMEKACCACKKSR